MGSGAAILGLPKMEVVPPDAETAAHGSQTVLGTPAGHAWARGVGARLSSLSETETAISCATLGGAGGQDVWEDEPAPLARDNRDDTVLGTLANVGRLAVVLFELQDLF